jgi:hypothetical protein
VFLRIVLFCTKHSLSPSVKAGGYGTAGWAINGDIIIDLSKLVGVDIEPPQQNGSFTSLRDMAAPGSKGKRKAGAPVIDASAMNAGKRRREDDAQLRSYDTASASVAGFLHGPALGHDGIDIPRRIIRRKLDADVPLIPSRDVSLETESSQDSSNSDISTDATSPSPPGSAAGKSAAPASSSADPFSYLGGPQGSSTATISPTQTSGLSDHRLPSSFSSSAGGDPFGYLSGPSGSSRFSPPSVAPAQPPTLRSWGQGASTLFANPSLPPLPQSLVIVAEPIHPHAYVTFGAGMRQKEIDRYTAANPLEATSLSGVPSFMPYHVPL